MSAQLSTVPSYLANHRDLYLRDPRQAALAWFADARFGLFIHQDCNLLLNTGPLPDGSIHPDVATLCEVGRRLG
jgi:hypothetical protein